MNGPSPAQAQSREIFFEGVAHFEAGRPDAARACFERCRALTPDRPSVLGNLGIALFHLGRTDEAVPLLEQATAADPSFADAWACLGLAHEAQGRWAAAAQALRASLAGGDGPAERWFQLGRCLSRDNRPAEALAALDRALERDAGHAAAWSLRGGLLRELQRPAEAAQAFEQAIAHGADRELHAYYLASVRGGPVPPQPPRAYVEALFDDYAADFDDHLVQRLGYRGHEELLRPIVAGGRRFRRAIDLGCGTGLCAPVLAPHCDAIDGVDLSRAMLEQAAARGLYRTLAHEDIVAFLDRQPAAGADLVVAADVLIYVGAPAPVFAAAARVLEGGGLFALTAEEPDDGSELQLLPSLRYAHSASSMRRHAAAHGFEVDELRTAPIRRNHGRPLPALYVTLRRRAA